MNIRVHAVNHAMTIEFKHRELVG